MNDQIQSLRAQVSELQAQVNTLEQEKLVAESNVADLVDTLDSIRQRATKAIKS
jgi:archaellum component FlaC